MTDSLDVRTASDAGAGAGSAAPGSRRVFLKRAAITSGAVLWTVPVIQSFDMAHAQAAAGSPPPTSSSEPPVGTGSIVGFVTDAASGAPIAGASVAAGTASATSADDGSYKLPGIPAGDVEVRTRARGYSPATEDVLVPTGGTVRVDPALSRLGELRVVLTWNDLESDLDLHLSGPDGGGGGGRFHVAYHDPNPVSHASLDRDDTDGEGPEVVTISIAPVEGDFVAGEYRVWVHDYPLGADTLDVVGAGASVSFFDQASQVADYSPAAASGDPSLRIWRVVDFALDDDGVVTTISPVQAFVPGGAATVF